MGHYEVLQHAELNKELPRILSVQKRYNLVNRIYELSSGDLSPMNLPCWLIRRWRRLSDRQISKSALPQGSRKQLFDRLQRYETPGADTGISACSRILRKMGLDASQLANQFVTTRDFVTSNIIGATTMEQLKLAVTSVDIEMSDELLGEIEAVHMRAPNVCPYFILG